MSMRAKQIGKRVKVLRQSKQWYQEDLAEKIGITQAHLSNIETGKVNITLEKLLLLHDVLGVPMAEFFCGYRWGAWRRLYSEACSVAACHATAAFAVR